MPLPGRLPLQSVPRFPPSRDRAITPSRPPPITGIAAQVDNGVVGMKFAVGLFEGFLYPLDALHNILRGNGLNIHGCRVSQQAQYGAVLPVPGVDLDLVLFS